MCRNIAIIGSGSWGISLSSLLAENGNNIKIWSFSETEKNEINIDRKSRYIPDLTINNNIICYNDLSEVCKDAEFIFHVTPSKVTREVFIQYKNFVQTQPIIICSKGFEKGSNLTLDKVFKEEKNDVKIAALSGPSFAVEVSNHIPTALLLASKNEEILNSVPEVISNENMRIYKSTDILGVEIGGGLKNIIALCTGVCTELKLGTNSEAALIARGLAEISRLGVRMGADKNTFYGLSGLGDLILTCSSDESRNRRAGRLIGKGIPIDEVKKQIGQTIESIDNLEIAKDLMEKYNVDMPIVKTACDVIFNGMTPQDAIHKLMTRSLKFEDY